MIFTLPYLLDLIGVAVFALSGSLVASRQQLDLIGFGLLASLTGIGGGTLRDLIIGRPVFWIQDQTYLIVCLAAALAVYLFGPLIQRRYIVLLWCDAVGLAAYGVLGAHIARLEGLGAMPALVMGVMTATFGGLARDIVGGETPLFLKQEIYVTAALAAACAYVGLTALGVPAIWAAAASVPAGFLVRAGGIAFNWTLPRYRPRGGRTY